MLGRGVEVNVGPRGRREEREAIWELKATEADLLKQVDVYEISSEKIEKNEKKGECS